MYCLSLSCMQDKTPFIIKGALSIFPTVCLNSGVLLLNKFGYHFRKFYNRDVFIYHTNYSIFFMYIMLIVDFFFYLFLGYYLNNVIPHDFGIRKPWYFLCTLSYWGLKKKKKYVTIDDKKEFPEFNSRVSLILEDEKKEFIRKKTLLLKKKTRKEQLYGRS